MERFAIIGFGCAGYHALRAIREAGCDAIVDVYSDTDMPPYNPMLTTYYTAGRLPYAHPGGFRGRGCQDRHHSGRRLRRLR